MPTTIELVVINDDDRPLRGAAVRPGRHGQPRAAEGGRADQAGRRGSRCDSNIGGRGHYVFIMHCNTAPFDNNDLRLALKYAIDRRRWSTRSCSATARSATTSRSTPRIPPPRPSSSSATTIPTRRRSIYKKSGFDGTVLLRTSDNCLPRRARCRRAVPAVGGQGRASSWRSSASRTTATGPRSGTCSRSAPPTGPAGRRRTRCISTAYLSTADWNDTRFVNAKFDQLLVAARGELDETKRKADVSRHGGDPARRGRADLPDVQRLCRRHHRSARRLGSTTTRGSGC